MSLDSLTERRIRDLERQLTVATAQRDTARAAWDMAMERRAVVLKLHSAHWCKECQTPGPCMTRIVFGAA